MSRKILSFALILSFVIILAACGGNNKENSNNTSTNTPETPAPVVEVEEPSNEYGDTGGLKLPLVDKPTTITWMLVGENPVDDKMIVKEIEKRTGITVDFQVVPTATFQDKLRVTMASGKLPDIFHGLKPAELKKMGQQKSSSRHQ